MKFGCFLCKWDSHAWQSQYSKKQWLLQPLIPGKINVTSQSLINPENVFLLPLYSKLCLMKNFAWVQNSVRHRKSIHGVETNIVLFSNNVFFLVHRVITIEDDQKETNMAY
jgi:hypothetical protein